PAPPTGGSKHATTSRSRTAGTRHYPWSSKPRTPRTSSSSMSNRGQLLFRQATPPSSQPGCSSKNASLKATRSTACSASAFFLMGSPPSRSTAQFFRSPSSPNGPASHSPSAASRSSSSAQPGSAS